MTGFYSSATWRRLRAECLRRHPVCATAGCGRFSVVADHIVPRSRGGTDTQDNLTGRCLTCHNSRRGTAEPRLRGCDAEGNPLDRGHWWHDGVGRTPPTTHTHERDRSLEVERGVSARLKNSSGLGSKTAWVADNPVSSDPALIPARRWWGDSDG
jgi:hypothetical protein